MHSPAATMASQNGHRNPAEMRKLIVIPPPKKPIGIAMFDVPFNGILTFKIDWRISGKAIRGIMKKITVNSGFL